MYAYMCVCVCRSRVGSVRGRPFFSSFRFKIYFSKIIILLLFYSYAFFDGGGGGGEGLQKEYVLNLYARENDEKNGRPLS